MRSEERFRRGDVRDEYVFPEHAASKETLEAVRFFFNILLSKHVFNIIL